MMSHGDLHMAVRQLLRGSRYQGFQISTHSTEQHPGRVFVEYVVHVAGIDRDYRSADPKRLLSWLREAVGTVDVADKMPEALRSIGSPARLVRIK